jgi:hypothetical protein
METQKNIKSKKDRRQKKTGTPKKLFKNLRAYFHDTLRKFIERRAIEFDFAASNEY